MLGNIDLKKLSDARSRLEELKNFKLAAVAQHHGNNDYEFSDLLEHFDDEIKELKELLEKSCIKLVVSKESITEFIENLEIELADVSNLCDLMAEYLERFREKKTK